MNNKLVVILDPAHGEEVAGKRSPDGLHQEYAWSRQICRALAEELETEGFRVEMTTTGEREIGLTNRKNFATNLVVQPGQTKFLLSLHNNAAGDGKTWLKATGVEIFTTKGQTKSDTFAETIINQLRVDFPKLTFRTDISDGDQDKEENFTVLTGSGYYAALLEWLFMDSTKDIYDLQDTLMNKLLVKSLVKAMLTINNTL